LNPPLHLHLEQSHTILLLAVMLQSHRCTQLPLPLAVEPAIGFLQVCLYTDLLLDVVPQVSSVVLSDG
jgi:hypothetical protein